MSPRHFPTDANTVQNNLREAATLTDAQLGKRTVYELRELLRVCGLKQVVRDGKQMPIREAKRDELLEALAIATSPYKLLANASIVLELVDEDIQKLDYESVRDLLKIAATLPTDVERLEKARTTAYEVNDWITRTYADTPHLARFYARCNQRGQYRSRVQELVKLENDLLLTAIYGVYSDTLNALGKHDSELKAKGNSERLTTYETNKRTVAVGKLHEWTLTTLDNPTATDWKNVAIAVAASTGRRMYSEVLAGTGSYKAVGEYELEFTGVAKGKEVNNDSYRIPTIAPASDVVRAIEVLEEKGKRIPCENVSDYATVIECRRLADKRHSKNVGDHWKKALCLTLLALDPTDEEAKKDDMTTLHGLRKLYVMHYTRNLSDREQRKVASDLLCHSGDGSVASDAYTSIFTLAD
jgi:hypothetical protein